VVLITVTTDNWHFSTVHLFD